MLKLVTEIAGIGAVLVGLAMVYPPLALIIGGLCVVAAIEVRA